MTGKKKFDCVQMKRSAQERTYLETRGMSDVELLAYWKKKEREFRSGVNPFFS
ncbi:MAG: hypothetical protein HZB29_01375 [Nitrospinae bacterium]|nr:hypothetical protein [Nitrospinota bacterium]